MRDAVSSGQPDATSLRACARSIRESSAHGCGPRKVETKSDELVKAPATSSARLIELVKLGRRLDLLGLIHVSSRIDPKPEPRMGHPSHFAGWRAYGDPSPRRNRIASLAARGFGSEDAPGADKADTGHEKPAVRASVCSGRLRSGAQAADVRYASAGATRSNNPE
jgi:hypothetical protein